MKGKVQTLREDFERVLTLFEVTENEQKGCIFIVLGSLFVLHVSQNIGLSR
jgi:hypothetical protein